MTRAPEIHESQATERAPLRVVTAAALFDGHDAAINVVRRLLQTEGAEVIHLGHDRSVEDVVTAAVQEDADAVAVSSYQGGHLEFFEFLVDRLREVGCGHVQVYGGGGGVISPPEVERLHAHGVTRIFRPEDGQSIGLSGMIRQILESAPARDELPDAASLGSLGVSDAATIGRLISLFESHGAEPELAAMRERLASLRSGRPAPVVGFTGTGGAGKSSLLDELIRRFRVEDPDRTIGVITVDPTRRRSGGALLGDRMRMNSIEAPHVFVRSLATRRAHMAMSSAVADALRVLQAADFDLILVETAGIGQSDSEIVDAVDLAVYVMTPEYGAPSQLEKIDMLDLADLVVLNKFDRRGAQDALRDVRKQWVRNHAGQPDAGDPPVFATIASRWNDTGTDHLHAMLSNELAQRGFAGFARRIVSREPSPQPRPLIGPSRTRYLAEIAESVRG